MQVVEYDPTQKVREAAVPHLCFALKSEFDGFWDPEENTLVFSHADPMISYCLEGKPYKS